MYKDKLKTFLNLLKKDFSAGKKTFDIGLMVIEPKSRIKKEGILKEVKKTVDIESLIYGKDSRDEEIFNKIIQSFQRSKWILLEITKDLSSPMLNQLKNLSNSNSFQIIDYGGKDVFEMKMPEKSRIIFLAERNFIEKEIRYPHFYTFFGPTLNIK